MSDVEMSQSDDFLYVRAYGGTRRQRGAAIAVAIRGLRLRHVYTSYSETYGFQTLTEIKYAKEH